VSWKACESSPSTKTLGEEGYVELEVLCGAMYRAASGGIVDLDLNEENDSTRDLRDLR
jgi:hypothetical protein